MPSKITPAATLARVQELHDAGNSFRKIAEMLAAEGVPAAGPRSRWHHANVSWCLLKDPDFNKQKAAQAPIDPPRMRACECKAACRSQSGLCASSARSA